MEYIADDRKKASLDAYSGNIRVNGDELFDFASARTQFAKRLELTVRAESAVSVKQLQALLLPYRDGNCPLILHYSNAKGSVPLKLGEDWRVTLHQDLIDALAALLDEQNVRIVYA